MAFEDYPPTCMNIPPMGDVDFGTKENMEEFIEFAVRRCEAAYEVWRLVGKAAIPQYEAARYEAYKQWQAECD